MTITEGRELMAYVANQHAVRMNGRNATFRLGPNTVLMRNAGSVEPRLDGWWLDEVAERLFGRGVRRIPQDQAERLIDTAMQLGTLEIL